MTDVNIFFEEKENIIPDYQTDKGKYLLSKESISQ